VFTPECHRLLAEELPDVLGRLLALGARELPVRCGDGTEVTAFAVRRPVFDWLLRRVAEREPELRVHAGATVRGLRTADDRLTGVMLGSGLFTGSLAVDATGRSGAVRRWLDELGHPSARLRSVGDRAGFGAAASGTGPDPAAGRGLALGVDPVVAGTDTESWAGPSAEPWADHYTRCYALHWPGDPTALNLGLAAGGDFPGYRCRVVPGDNDTFSVTFTVPRAEAPAARRTDSGGVYGGVETAFTPEADSAAGLAGLAGRAGRAALCDPDGFQAVAARVPWIADWVDSSVAMPLSPVRTWRPRPRPLPRPTPGGEPLDGLVSVGDAIRPGRLDDDRGVAVALASGLAAARAIEQAWRDGSGVPSVATLTAVERAGRASGCGHERVPGPSSDELAELLTSVVHPGRGGRAGTDLLTARRRG
jgi:hypothetical protein